MRSNYGRCEAAAEASKRVGILFGILCMLVAALARCSLAMTLKYWRCDFSRTHCVLDSTSLMLFFVIASVSVAIERHGIPMILALHTVGCHTRTLFAAMTCSCVIARTIGRSNQPSWDSLLVDCREASASRNDNRQKIFEIPNQAKSNPHINTRFVGIHERIAHLANLACERIRILVCVV